MPASPKDPTPEALEMAREFCSPEHDWEVCGLKYCSEGHILTPCDCGGQESYEQEVKALALALEDFAAQAVDNFRAGPSLDGSGE